MKQASKYELRIGRRTLIHCIRFPIQYGPWQMKTESRVAVDGVSEKNVKLPE